MPALAWYRLTGRFPFLWGDCSEAYRKTSAYVSMLLICSPQLLLVKSGRSKLDSKSPSHIWILSNEAAYL